MTSASRARNVYVLLLLLFFADDFYPYLHTSDVTGGFSGENTHSRRLLLLPSTKIAFVSKRTRTPIVVFSVAKIPKARFSQQRSTVFPTTVKKTVKSHTGLSRKKS